MKFLATLFIAIAVTACSGKPSDSDVKRQYLEFVTKAIDPKIMAVENFERVNGFQQDEKTYVVDVKYDIVMTKSFEQIARETSKDIGGMLSLVALEEQVGRFKEGHRVTRNDKATFLKTEKGWVLQ